jgi:uncharacterized protein DUF1326
MAYRLQGSILAVCACKVLCPCWIGEDPDPGTCDSTVAYYIDTGSVKRLPASHVIRHHLGSEELDGTHGLFVGEVTPLKGAHKVVGAGFPILVQVGAHGGR